SIRSAINPSQFNGRDLGDRGMEPGGIHTLPRWSDCRGRERRTGRTAQHSPDQEVQGPYRRSREETCGQGGAPDRGATGAAEVTWLVSRTRPRLAPPRVRHHSAREEWDTEAVRTGKCLGGLDGLLG